MSAAIELGGGEIVATSNKAVSDGEEHTVKVNRYEHQLSIMVDDSSEATIGNPISKQLNLGANPELHLGGVPKDSKYYG